MLLEIATLIAEAANDSAHGLDVELRLGYSGRGMFGRETAALIVSGLSEFTAAACEATIKMVLTGQDTDDLIDAVRHVRADNMGRDSIVIY